MHSGGFIPSVEPGHVKGLVDPEGKETSQLGPVSSGVTGNEDTTLFYEAEADVVNVGWDVELHVSLPVFTACVWNENTHNLMEEAGLG